MTKQALSPLWDTKFSPLPRFVPAWGPWGESLERFFNLPTAENGGAMPWAPQVDVTETDGAYVFKAEVPGIAPDDIKVSVTSAGLTLSGEKTEEEKSESDNYVRTERRYGSFQRSFAFPDNVDPDKVKAETKNGVLTVTVNKAKPSKANHVKVQSR